VEEILERRKNLLRCTTREPDEILRKIYVCKIYNTSHLEVIIQNLGKSIEEYKAKLVMVDSIIALHRAEFTVEDIGGGGFAY